ncbi:MAG TPA: hypothetical protein VH054_12495 [Polyangiaceae bacterium]|jgi:hypothetical protein|nr:hypothetical protein [Polyangiaceae bacterium]
MRRLLPSVAVAIVLVACVSDDSGSPDGGGSDATLDAPSSADGGGDTGVDAGPPIGDSVITRANHDTRDALYVQSTFGPQAISTIKLDSTFDGTVSGNVYAQVLFFQNGPNGKPVIIAATSNDQLTAMDADTGAVVWQKTFGTPAGASGAGCGNISPLGITGTPAIDPATRTIFFSAVTGTNATITDHVIHAVSLDDGTEKPGFPVNASTASYQGTKFSPPVQNQRGAILYVNGVIYVPYGGHAGDCGSYHGWVVGVPFPAGSPVTAYAASIAANTRAAGIWAPGGPSSDGTDVFVTTGNTFGATTWVGQEAVLRFTSGPTFSNQTADYWAPHNFLALDNGDVDIGGTGSMVVDVPGATPSKLIVALGKDGNAYLIDRTNLGGIGASTATDGIANLNVASGEIINTPASVTTGGATYVYLRPLSGSGVKCATGSGDLVAVKITPASPPTMSVVWCATSGTQGSPIVTTTDGSANPIVWVVGTKLLGFDGVSGKPVYTGTDTVANVRKFTSPIAAHGRIYIGADDKVYAFKQ